MTNALDMSLDELIKHNKSGGRGGGRGRRGNYRGRRGALYARNYAGARTLGPYGRQWNRASGRQNPYATVAKFTRQTPDGAWQRNKYESAAEILPPLVRPLGIETGTKLYISNLDYGVSNDDIKELFSEVGDVKRCSVHYDHNGRSKGTAEVVFTRKADGMTALKQYSNVQLDGKAMNIELIGTNLITPAALPPVATIGIQPWSMARVATGISNGFYDGRDIIGMPYPAPQSQIFGVGRTRGRSSFRGRWGYHGRRRGQGRSRGQGRGRSTAGLSAGIIKSAEDMDAELETYHSEAMRT